MITDPLDQNPDRFRQIYESQVDFVYRRLRRLGVSAQDLEDTVHDVFVVVHRRMADYDPARPMRRWVAGISVRVAAEYRRRAFRRREVVKEEVEVVAPDRSPETEAAASEARDLVLRALDKLSDDQRVVFVLHELEGCSMPEIAEIVAAPLNTCYSRLRLARSRFNQLVAAMLAPQEGGR